MAEPNRLRCGCSQSFRTGYCTDCREYICGTHWKIHAGHAHWNVLSVRDVPRKSA